MKDAAKPYSENAGDIPAATLSLIQIVLAGLSLLLGHMFRSRTEFEVYRDRAYRVRGSVKAAEDAIIIRANYDAYVANWSGDHKLHWRRRMRKMRRIANFKKFTCRRCDNKISYPFWRGLSYDAWLDNLCRAEFEHEDCLVKAPP